MSMSDIDIEKGIPPVRVEATNVAGGLASHLAIVVRGKNGKETGYRGGPSRNGSLSSSAQQNPTTGATDYGFGAIVTTSGEYAPGFIDYKTDASKVAVDLNGQSVDTVTKCFEDTMKAIDARKIAYYPTGPNSNSVVGTMLSRCGCQKVKPVWIAPGFDTDLLG